MAFQFPKKSNEAPARLEGTFYFPLPPDASLSRLAMYVNGKLMEGGMTEHDHARQVFESIVSKQRDPALLEWVDGSVFRLRVFPLEGRQEKRIILSYTQRLPTLHGRLRYSFPVGHTLREVGTWSFHARIRAGASLAWSSPSHALRERRDGADLILEDRAQPARLDRDLELSFFDPLPAEKDSARFSSSEHEDVRYLMLRYQPAPALTQRKLTAFPRRRDWVFLFESSADRSPLVARAQIEVIRAILANAEHEDTFAVVTAGTRVHTWAEQLMPATRANQEAALAWLGQAHLIGALDLGQGLERARPLLEQGSNPYLVHIGGGLARLGVCAIDLPAQSIPDRARYVGIGVGKRWNRAFMQTAANRTGGYFTQIQLEESINWRVFELLAVLQTPRLSRVEVVDRTGAVQFLTHSGLLVEGEEVCAIARLNRRDALPRSVGVQGYIDGQPFERVLPVEQVAEQADYLPRTWAKLEIDRLLAEDADVHREAIVALSKAMYVMTPFTSLLVLENEEMYEQYKVDRGRKDHWALYPCPPTIPVVKEGPVAEQQLAPGRRPAAEEVLESITIRAPLRLLKTFGPADEEMPSNLQALPLDQWMDRHLGVESVTNFRPEPPPGQYGPFRERFVNMSGFGIAGFGGLGGVSNIMWFQPEPLMKPMPNLQEPFADLVDKPQTPADWRQTRWIREKLAATVTFEGFEAQTPLKKALQALSERYDLTIHLNAQAFREDLQINEPDALPVQLAPVAHVKLETVLRLILQEISGDYIIRADHVEVTTPMRRLAERHSRATDYLSGLGAEALRFNTPGLPSAGWDTRSSIAARRRLPQELRGRFGARGLETAAAWRTRVHLDRIERVGQVREEPQSTGDRDPETIITRLVNAHYRTPPYYRPWIFSGEETVFTDVLAYAPGANATRADLLAELETRAEPDALERLGSIDPAARTLIDRARAAGWKAVSAEGTQPMVLLCDGRGRYTYERTLPVGLRERVVCDGKTLWHLYPELNLGTRRVVSRFHQVELAQLVPWFLPSSEALARGADLRAIAERTVALVPHGPNRLYGPDGKLAEDVALQLAFAEDGRLAERRLVERASAKVRFRELYGADGSVRRVGADGREMSTRRWTVHKAADPLLVPDTRGMLLMDWPSFAWAAPVPKIIAMGPLARYFVLARSGRLRQRVDLGPDYPLLQRLLDLRVLYNCRRVAASDAELAAEIQRLDGEPHDALAWAKLGLLVERCGNSAALQQRLAEAYRLFEDNPELAYQAGYEHARHLLYAGHRHEAAQRFRALVRKTLAQERLPPIDRDFRLALLDDDHAGDRSAWDPFMHQTALMLLDQGHAGLVVDLAWQCRAAGDTDLADRVLDQALRHAGESGDRRRVTLLAVEYRWQSDQLREADRILGTLLADPKYARDSRLWRLAATLAAQAKLSQRWLHCLERAVDLECEHIPDDIDLQAVQNDLGLLLAHYQYLARAYRTLEESPPGELVSKVVCTADRWRALDPDSSLACIVAAQTLFQLGTQELNKSPQWGQCTPHAPREDFLTRSVRSTFPDACSYLAWEYLNTPAAFFPPGSESWRTLAEMLNKLEAFELAELAYRQATATEAIQVWVVGDEEWGQLLWNRARNLEQAGRFGEARLVYRHIAEGRWSFGGAEELIRQARARLDHRTR